MKPAWIWSPVAVLLAAVSCAHVEAPPGGPEDETAPFVISTSLDSLAIVPELDEPITFEFSERISEQGVDDAVIVAPRTSPVEIRRGRSGIRVSLRQGWRPGVVYQITLLPEIRDLFNNSLEEPFRFFFSTGPPIPDTEVSGSVIDRITGRAADDIRVEAIRAADSLVYSIQSDAEGDFSLVRIPPGEYRVRAFRDLSRDRVLDDYEPRDTATAIVLQDSVVSLALAILEPDSTAPVAGRAEGAGRIVTVEFDDYLDPDQAVSTEQVSVARAAGGQLQILRAVIGELPDSTAPADTIARLPSQIVEMEVAEADSLVAGGGYVASVEGVRNVNGLIGGGSAEFELPEPPPDP